MAGEVEAVVLDVVLVNGRRDERVDDAPLEVGHGCLERREGGHATLRGRLARCDGAIGRHAIDEVHTALFRLLGAGDDVRDHRFGDVRQRIPIILQRLE